MKKIFLVWLISVNSLIAATVEYVRVKCPAGMQLEDVRKRYMYSPKRSELLAVDIKREDFELDKTFTLNLSSGVAQTNELLNPVFYLSEKEPGLYEVKDDIYQGRIVFTSYRFDGSFVLLTIKSVLHNKTGRHSFAPVPSWDVGTPIINSCNELSYEDLMLKKGWVFLGLKSIEDVVYIDAIRFSDKSPEATEYNKDNVQTFVIPLQNSNIKKRTF